jgi:hypothetical protein
MWIQILNRNYNSQFCGSIRKALQLVYGQFYLINIETFATNSANTFDLKIESPVASPLLHEIASLLSKRRLGVSMATVFCANSSRIYGA